MASITASLCSALVFHYLEKVDKNIARNFRNKTKTSVLAKGSPGINDILIHYLKTNTLSKQLKLSSGDSEGSSSEEGDPKTALVNGRINLKKPLAAKKGSSLKDSNAKKQTVRIPAIVAKPANSSSEEVTSRVQKQLVKQMQSPAKPNVKKADSSSEESSFEEGAPQIQQTSVVKVGKQNTKTSVNAKPITPVIKKNLSPTKSTVKKDDSSSDESSSDEPNHSLNATPHPRKTANLKNAFHQEESSSQDESSSEEDAVPPPSKHVAKPVQKPSVAKFPRKNLAESSSEEDSSSDDEPAKSVSNLVKKPVKPSPQVSKGTEKSDSEENSSEDVDTSKVITKKAKNRSFTESGKFGNDNTGNNRFGNKDGGRGGSFKGGRGGNFKGGRGGNFKGGRGGNFGGFRGGRDNSGSRGGHSSSGFRGRGGRGRGRDGERGGFRRFSDGGRGRGGFRGSRGFGEKGDRGGFRKSFVQGGGNFNKRNSFSDAQTTPNKKIKFDE